MKHFLISLRIVTYVHIVLENQLAIIISRAERI